MRTRLVALALMLPLSAQAQEPLSAINWLTIPPAGDRAGQLLLEPPVTDSGTGPEIIVTPLATIERPLGLVPAHVTGLPVEMWQASRLSDVERHFRQAKASSTPATQTLLYTLLLAETRPPAGTDAAERFLDARLDMLFRMGAVEPAQAMVETAGPEATASRFATWFDATLLSGDEHVSCASLNRAPHLSEDYAARMFCTLRKGDWSAAAIMLDAARTLGLMPQEQLFLLDRFLNPDLYELAPPLPAPEAPDPLTFRIFEAIGEPLPTAPLPRLFAVAELRDVAGWKAQLEAAERLARTGAISPNRLLGIYTDRLPAASGGVWDRVAAVQKLDRALADRDAPAVARRLPAAWQAMQAAHLEVPFATVFADALALIPLDDPEARRIAMHMRLLSPEYEAVAADSALAPLDSFLAGLARGTPPARGADARQQAIADGFTNPPEVPGRYQRMLEDGRLGEAILHAISGFDHGRDGNLAELTSALRLFRFVGLEDTARQAALQMLILGQG